MLALQIQLQRGHLAMRVHLTMTAQVLGIVGDSGSGKSTLLHVLCGLIQPQQGKISLFDRVLFDSQQRINIPTHQRRVAMVFQDSRLFPHLTVQQNLCYGYDLLASGQARFALDEIVDLFEIRPLLQQRPHQLSGGETQRVAIGRALLMSPQLLLLDEPLSALDQKLKQQILPYLKQLKRYHDLAMIYVSHDADEVAYLADQVMTMQQGCLAQNT